MLYDRNDYLPKAEYAKACKVPECAVKLRGASYTIAHTIDENSLFSGFGIKHGMATSLFSYGTGICDWCADVLIISVNAFGYSNTTCRHLSEFLRRYTSIPYYKVKDVLEREDPIAGQFFEIDGVTVLFV